MEPSKIITLTTDFGSSDSYVGQMKGAALAIDPDVRIVDLCHGVPPQDLRAGAYILESGYAAFPSGTVHVAVVDPGVGTERRMVAVRAGEYVFVAPDNGLLTRVLDRERITAAHQLQNTAFFGPRRSTTFAGRDVFAPAAAWICHGVELERLGPPVDELLRLDVTYPRLELGQAVRVPVLAVDHFGNVVLDVTATALTAVLGHAPDIDSPLALRAEGGDVTRFCTAFAAGGSDEAFFIVNSAGYLEVAVDGGSAAERLGLRRGMHPELQIGR